MSAAPIIKLAACKALACSAKLYVSVVLVPIAPIQHTLEASRGDKLTTAVVQAEEAGEKPLQPPLKAAVCCNTQHG